MQQLTSLECLRAEAGPWHLALGVFDGVHVGHRAVIARAVAAARRDGGKAVVVTFDPHPVEVMAPERAPHALVGGLEHKARLLAETGVEVMVVLPFDRAMAAREAVDFLGDLVSCGPRTICVGEDWRFGRGRAGDVDVLRAAAMRCGFALEAVEPVMVDGERVSSTRIRQAVRDGSMTAAEEMLGRPYRLVGRVVSGRKLGRTIGFPTANLATGRMQLPPDGVWVVRMSVDGGEWLPGVANLGVRPTVDGVGRMLEVHVLDAGGDFYDRTAEVEPMAYLRGEKKFAGLEELKAGIAADVRRARELLAAEG